MWQLLKQNLIAPALRRVGTIAATALVVGGGSLCEDYHICGLVTQSGVEQVVTWVIAAALVLIDVAITAAQKGKSNGS